MEEAWINLAGLFGGVTAGPTFAEWLDSTF
jgi:hypothetical protein